MGSRYTKSIPEFIYFTDQGNGWFSGPFVKNPCKGKNANNDALIICKVERLTKLVTESTQLPLATRPAERPYTQEELDNLAKWLKSEEGINKIRQAQIDANKAIEALGLNESIDPKILNTPFNI
jgi:hypothetical protein